MSIRHSLVRLLAGAVLGAAVGAGAALIASPHSGDTTRSLLKQRGAAYRRRALVFLQNRPARLTDEIVL